MPYAYAQDDPLSNIDPTGLSVDGRSAGNLCVDLKKSKQASCEKSHPGGVVEYGSKTLDTVVKVVAKVGGPVAEVAAGAACVSGIASAEGCPALIAITTAASNVEQVATHNESTGAALVDAVAAGPGLTTSVAERLDVLGGGKTIMNWFSSTVALGGLGGSWAIDHYGDG